MNITTTATIIEIFVVCCTVSFFYWYIARPVGIRAIRFRLFGRRDKLRKLALDHEVDHHSFVYRELEEFMCKTLCAVPSLSLASFIIFSIRNPNPTSEEMGRFREEAPPELQTLLGKTVKDAVYLMMLNSPILVSVAALLVLVLWLAGRFNRIFLFRKAEQFVDELPIEGRYDGDPLPA